MTEGGFAVAVRVRLPYLGRVELHCSIAGLRLTFQCESVALADAIRHRFESYEVGPGAATDALLILSDEGVGWENPLPYDRAVYPEAAMTFADGTYRFRRMEFEGEVQVNLPITTGHFRVRRDRHAFETPVRLLCALAGARRGILFLHSSGALFDGGALIFSALSGGGKTTLLSLLKKVVPLSDEIVGLSLHAGDGVTAWATPFTGGPTTARQATGPLRGLCFIQKGLTHQLSPATGGRVIRRLLRNTLAYVADGETAQGLLDIASELVRRVPVFELTFNKVPDVESFLFAALASFPPLPAPSLLSHAQRDMQERCQSGRTSS